MIKTNNLLSSVYDIELKFETVLLPPLPIKTVSFHENGQLAFAASYKQGKLIRWLIKWEENGSLFLDIEYVVGEMISEIDFN